MKKEKSTRRLAQLVLIKMPISCWETLSPHVINWEIKYFESSESWLWFEIQYRFRVLFISSFLKGYLGTWILKQDMCIFLGHSLYRTYQNKAFFQSVLTFGKFRKFQLITLKWIFLWHIDNAQYFYFMENKERKHLSHWWKQNNKWRPTSLIC